MAHFSSTLFMEPSSSKPSLLERLSALLTREPEDREELLHLLHSAHDRNLFDADALAIIEGALQVSDMQVGRTLTKLVRVIRWNLQLIVRILWTKTLSEFFTMVSVSVM